MVEAQTTADEMYRYRPKESADGIDAAANLGAGTGRQEAKAQLTQKRQAPFVVGEAGARLTLGEVSRPQCGTLPNAYSGAAKTG